MSDKYVVKSQRNKSYRGDTSIHLQLYVNGKPVNVISNLYPKYRTHQGVTQRYYMSDVYATDFRTIKVAKGHMIAVYRAWKSGKEKNR
jgi:hypothetical protein